MKLSIRFDHGLGDCANFAHLLPLWLKRDYQITLHCNRDKLPVFRAVPGLRVLADQPLPIDCLKPPWNHPRVNASPIRHEPWDGNKVGWGLHSGEIPLIGRPADLWPELLQVQLSLASVVTTEHSDRIAELLAPLARPLILIHSKANTSAHLKDMPDDVFGNLCQALFERTPATVVALDWDQRMPRIDHPRYKHMLDLCWLHGEELWCLMEAADLLVAVDSGPLHFARLTRVPVLGYWRDHHPVHFALPRENTLHLVPRGLHPEWTDARRMEWSIQTTDGPPSSEEIFSGVQKMLTHGAKPLTVRHYGQPYYDEHRRWGCDYLVYGTWQQRYGKWLAESLAWQGQRVLDVGCACGALTRGLLQAGADARGCDLSEWAIGAGRRAWPEMAERLQVCDAVNLHGIDTESFDAIHSQQSAEHWRPDLVPSVLRELLRVTRHGGLFLCFLDTSERGVRDGFDDPTHTCLQPLAWWESQAQAAGWTICTAAVKERLMHHPLEMQSQNGWSFFAGSKL